MRAAQACGLVPDRVAAAIPLIEALTTGGPQQVAAAATCARQAGLESRALLGAGYINFGFNVINRIADALGVALPESPDLNRAASLLLTVGYRSLSGWPFARNRSPAPESLDQRVEQIALTAVHGPGVLPKEVREALFAGTASGSLGQFAPAVAERASTLTRVDTLALGQNGYVEDEIFEAVVCAALGVATRRLTWLRNALAGRVAAVPARPAS